MSLVGSLEDLGLADLLQVVNLARKSGVLALRGEEGEGRIVFRDGLVHAAAVKGGADAPPPGAAPEDAQVESRREQIERAVSRMFEWHSGEFSFDVRDGLDPADAGPVLSVGLSPQYLTMEATRRGDELRAGMDGCGEEALAFSGEADAAAADAHAALVDAVLRRADPAPEGPLGRIGGGAAAARPRADAVRAACASAVVIDPDLPLLEWLKATLEGVFERVHIFQGTEDGIARIRQYLSRGELPAVVLSDRAPMDPLSGIGSASELLRRLRVQAPRMPLLLLAEEGASVPRAARFADSVLRRPAAASLRDPRGAGRIAGAAEALRSQLARFARPRAT